MPPRGAGTREVEALPVKTGVATYTRIAKAKAHQEAIFFIVPMLNGKSHMYYFEG